MLGSGSGNGSIAMFTNKKQPRKRREGHGRGVFLTAAFFLVIVTLISFFQNPSFLTALVFLGSQAMAAAFYLFQFGSLRNAARGLGVQRYRSDREALKLLVAVGRRTIGELESLIARAQKMGADSLKRHQGRD